MSTGLKDLYSRRQGKYVKKAEDENFLLELNKTLQEKEQSLYGDYDINYPLIFVFGLPRSGTTLMSQIIAHTLDIGYMNNFMARFWLAPVHGIRLSKMIFGDQKHTSFQSDYASTTDVLDIHEYGYFWRHWLKKESFYGVTHAREVEKQINWEGLYRTLANMQHEFERPMIFKNIFGSYHLNKMIKVLRRIVYVYIQRDPLDVAVSILGARKRYYKDLNTWWSYMPVEYETIRDMDYWRQISGQVFFLRRYYDQQIASDIQNCVLSVSYKQLVNEPQQVMTQIQSKSLELYNFRIPFLNKPPDTLTFRTYDNLVEEKARFAELMAEFEENY